MPVRRRTTRDEAAANYHAVIRALACEQATFDEIEDPVLADASYLRILSLQAQARAAHVEARNAFEPAGDCAVV